MLTTHPSTLAECQGSSCNVMQHFICVFQLFLYDKKGDMKSTQGDTGVCVQSLVTVDWIWAPSRHVRTCKASPGKKVFVSEEANGRSHMITGLQSSLKAFQTVVCHSPSNYRFSNTQLVLFADTAGKVFIWHRHPMLKIPSQHTACVFIGLTSGHGVKHQLSIDKNKY